MKNLLYRGLLVFTYLFLGCSDISIPKPHAMLRLEYPLPNYKKIPKDFPNYDAVHKEFKSTGKAILVNPVKYEIGEKDSIFVISKDDPADILNKLN